MKSKRPPCCPRCGYDQSGVIAAWAESCPVLGTCSECGLVFRWSDIFHPDRDRVAGFVEHARGIRGLLWAVVRTAWLAARPWVFWTRVMMHMEPRLGRAVLWVVLVCVGMWMVLASIHSAFVVIESNIPGMTYNVGVARGYPVWYYVLAAWVDPFGSVWYTPGTGRLVWTWGLNREWTDDGLWVQLVSTALWPALFVLLPQTRRRVRVRPAHLWRGLAYSWVWLLVLDVPWVLAFVHRFWHMLMVAAGWAGPRRYRTWLSEAANALGQWERFGLWFIVPVWMWLWLWWWMAIKRGFRMPHAVGVAAALGVINAILTALAWASTWIVQVAW